MYVCYSDAIACTTGLPTLGITVASQASDVGMTILQGHSSVRTTGRPPTPESAYAEQFKVLVSNEVAAPHINRNSISCRKPHRESSRGHFVYDLDPEGKPIKREGFMMGCKRDSDCQTCGEHPISGKSYVCTPNPQFYTFFVVNESQPSGVFVDEPGDDQFDIVNHTGVCTDFRVDYAHTQCQSRAGSAAILSLSGCTARLGWVREMCGAGLIIPSVDYLAVGIEESSLEYPRTIVPSSTFNGRVEEAITCADPSDCTNKCLRLNRKARDGGLPAPQPCSLCHSMCASNVGTTIFMTMEALTQDISTAFRIASFCLGDAGLMGCVCNIFQFLRPAWLDNLPSPQSKCEGGNVFGLIAKKILEMIVSNGEAMLNGFIITPINIVLEVMLGWLTFGNPPQVRMYEIDMFDWS